jgi:two-component system, OmpR family, KDP operon response regulator KdpE
VVVARRILACDDEPQVLRALRVILREGGYETIGAASIAEAIDASAADPPDGAIVDLLLPDGSGIDLCRELRSWSTMPILVLSGLDEEEQKVQALRAGADDYVVKPFSAAELIARLDAVFRRVSTGGEEPVLLIRGLEINFPAHTVKLDGREIHLTPTEFNLLGVLARNRGRLMTSRALLEEVWGAQYVTDAPLLRTHVANIRHKIEHGCTSGWTYIRTEPGVGYRFSE